MKLSYVIVTHNRREPLLRTLRHLRDTTPLPRGEWETWVVDNASADGTDAAVRGEFPEVNYLPRAANEGVWARSVAFKPARGEHVILLDDDSYPIDDAVTRSLDHLARNPACAAVVGKVVLPDGTEEGCAFPAVMLSGAVCIRREVLLSVGGFRPEFFRKAGEYDLSYRIWQAGHSVERLDDVVYRHDKVMGGRSKPFAHRMDLRNNLILVERYLPSDLRGPVREDVVQRYAALARAEGCARASMQARIEGFLWRLREMATGRQTLSAPTVEALYQLDRQAALVAEWAGAHGVRSVVISDLSKNLYATHRACLRAGLEIRAVADDGPAFAGLVYRGARVVPLAEALALSPDGVVVSNVNPAQCPGRTAKVRAAFAGPVLPLWRPAFSRLVPPAQRQQAA